MGFFSPAQLVFGHSICGPLKLLSEQVLENEVALIQVTWVCRFSL